jgi:hypothetical protein
MAALAASLFLGSVLAAGAYAAEAGLTQLPITSTDRKTWNAKLAVGLSIDGGKTWSNTAQVNDTALIRGEVAPDPAHVGLKGDIFVIERVGSQFTMKNSAGSFVPWNLRVADIVPFMEDVTLSATVSVDVFNGKLAVAGDHRIFLGYLPAGSTGLIYTASPARLDIAPAGVDAFDYFESTVLDNIILKKCVLCHVKDGVSDGRTELLFVNDANLSQQNFDTFANFFKKKADAYDWILSKASGGEGHVGGNQLPNGSSDYRSMADFLALLDGSGGTVTDPVPQSSFFTGVELLPHAKTLRRAAIMLAGRLPTDSELKAVANGNDTALRSTLLGLMTGPAFHDFIKDAANDRLLLRGQNDFNLLDDCVNCFPGYARKRFELEEQALKSGTQADMAKVWEYDNQLEYSFRESPLELFATVVENDLPYSEVLTADYEMMTPVMNQAIGGTAGFTTDTGIGEFRIGRMRGFYRPHESVKSERVPFFNFDKLIDPGILQTNYPHVGILNTRAFLTRYPSTATNRNRARARWTFMHFLGVDIEQSAQRTTDPVALADTNNPTMNNPNCTVCHAIMDPVAGTFQDYSDGGIYKFSFGGMDSLDPFYKFPDSGTSLYQQGDTWYRDMRAPGFNQQQAGNASNTLRWVVQQIVKDPRFATAAVKFWWPAVIGTELIKRPEVATDVDYQARLSAFEAQEATINTLAANFTQSGMKVRTLLVDLVMSEWFRAGEVDPAQTTQTMQQAHVVAGLGNEKLLTPEQLSRKSRALTGFSWNTFIDNNLDKPVAGLERDYKTYYGGIDSFGIKNRTRELTPLMSTVAMAHGIEASCPIVLGEFMLSEPERKLFAGIDGNVTPLTEESMLKTVTSKNESDPVSFTMALTLNTGPKKVAISFLNDWCDWDDVAKTCKSDRDMLIDGISIQRPNGVTTRMNGAEGVPSGDCGGRNGSTQLRLWSGCTADFKFNADQSGTYTIVATLAAKQAGSDLVLAGIGVDADMDPLESTARGATSIKNKLVELHAKMLGQTLAVDSPEIRAAYDLLVQTWLSRKDNKFSSLFNQDYSCNWGSDIGFIDYLGYPGDPIRVNSGGWYEYKWEEIGNWLGPFAQDPTRMKGSWVVVMTYLMTHYHYLYE